jgi:ABC-type transport system involved in multi-copper enzyme maturation permease subunit
MTLRGTLLVAQQESRVRLRSRRWQWLLAAWVAVTGGFCALVWLDLGRNRIPAPQRGSLLFAAIALFLLTLVLLVSPALAARSVSGDREGGTLAALQVTQLSAGDIAVGKLASEWLTVLTALTLTAPFVVWPIVTGGAGRAGAGRAARTIAVIAVLAAVVCAIAQALSALVDRTIAAALLSYLAVFALTFGTLITFGLTLGFDAHGALTAPHPDRAWWLLAPNPYAIVGDAADAAWARPAPQPGSGPVMVRPQIMVIGGGRCVVPGSAACAGQPANPARVRVFRLPPGGPLYREAAPARASAAAADPLDAISNAVRAARGGPVGGAPGPVWPYGLGFDALAGAVSLWVTITKLKTPARALPWGRRIA